MYNSNMYFVIAVLTVLITWVVAGIYYYVINSVRFSRWYHWLIMLAAVTFCAPTVTYVYPNAEFTSQSYDYAVELMNFAVVNLAVTIVMFIIASFSIRWWSSQCRHTPIPQ
ncbi:hypothetical protein AGMMS4957_09580 [Bacteroidia bacterium]|nr:hypothetical protein AGMMS4957_09580 [Bacteroidia bacterium]